MIKHAISLPAAGQPSTGADGSDVEPRGRGQLMQLSKQAGTLALVALMSLVLAAVVVNHSLAQTDFKILGTQPSLERDYQEELDKWMLRAYEGDRDAQFKVGVLFTNEQFDRPDFEQAVYWYKQAARQGHVLAQYNLGHQYLSGVGVDKSETEAMDWWLKAAKQGHALAQFNIGRAYYLGIGLGEDHTKSRDWFERAARNGEPKSIEILEQLGWAEKGQYSQQMADSNNPKVQSSTDASAAVKNEKTDANTPETTATNTKSAEPVPVNESNSGDENSSEVDNEKKSPIAIYTDPSVRSVLIAIVDMRDELELIKESDMWSTVTSRTGFPVWVHADYLTAVDGQGTISGDAVNARSVPIVTNGTIVGRLNRGETVTVLDQRNEWYRVTAPARFKAWVKTNDFKAAPELIEIAESAPVEVAAPSKQPEPSTPKNDNAWLFSQPAESYTLQLASFDDPAKVSEFISRTKFADNPDLHRFSAQGKDIVWTYFLYGNYQDKAQAEKAKQEIKQKRAWVRSFGRLQQNRCVAWKKQLPTPKELNIYCVE